MKVRGSPNMNLDSLRLSDGNKFDGFGHVTNNTWTTDVQDQATPKTYLAPMPPPPAPRKPKVKSMLDNPKAACATEDTSVRCITEDEWTKAGDD